MCERYQSNIHPINDPFVKQMVTDNAQLFPGTIILPYFYLNWCGEKSVDICFPAEVCFPPTPGIDPGIYDL